MAGDQWLGAELAGYRIDALIGHGATGVVYRATHLRLHRLAAVKLLTPSLSSDPDYRRRFEREARLTASLDHPHLVPIYDTGQVDGALYLAMRLIDGPNLAALIDAEAPMPLPRACQLLTGIAEALDAAHHAGLVHRDVKPANILTTSGRHAYLCDFGIARHTATTSALTTAGQFLGTLRYCAPEQIQGQAVDGRADQYALACVVFHCLTGRVPYPSGDPATLMYAHVSADPPRPSAYVSTLPASVDDILARALAKQPDQRFATCTELLRALTTAGDPPSTSSPHTVIWPPSQLKQHAEPEKPTTTENHTEQGCTPGAKWRNIVHAAVSILFAILGIACFWHLPACTTVTLEHKESACLITYIGLGISCLLTLSVPILYWHMAKKGISLRNLKLCRIPYIIPIIWILAVANMRGF